VDSAVVALEPRAEPLTRDPEAFLGFARTCFRQKRKTLRNNLLAGYDKSLVDSLPGLERRAEQLPVEELIQLHQRILKG
ncbi:MAG: rRNA adenine N-6-methyltransferase family protein, partial [Bryobacteraceae bacterium]